MKSRLVVVYILVLIMLSSFVYAQTVELRNHEPIKINGRTFELNGRGDEYVYIEVDGNFMKVSENELTYENGVYIQALGIYSPYGDNPLIVIVEISMDYVCGNDVCELGEDQYCCTDCNCSQQGYVCLENACFDSALNVCNNNIDCNDSNACTNDICSGVPLDCTYEPVTKCVQGDGCCPEGCNVSLDYINNDYDCFPEPECWTDFDCDDGDEETFNLCDKRLKFCKYEKGINYQSINKKQNNVNQSNIDEMIENNNNNIFKYVVPSLIVVVIVLLVTLKMKKRKLDDRLIKN